MSDTLSNRQNPPPLSEAAGRAVVMEPRAAGRHGGAMRAKPAAPPALLDIIGHDGLIKFALLATAVIFLYWDQCVRLVRYWINNPDWSHGWLIPIFCAYFIHSRRGELARAPVRPSWLGLPVVLLAVAIYFAAIYLWIGYPQPVSMVMLIAGLVILCCGWRVFWIVGFAVGFLLLALPPPERLYREITQPLQQIAAFAAEHVLGAFPGVAIERYGINILFDRVGGKSGSFTVAGACSGMRSLMAFVALGLAMAYFSPRPVWHRVILALVVVPVAVFCNMIRVVITGAFTIYDYGNLAVGTPHAMLGIGTFALGFLIYSGFIYVLDHLFVAEDEADRDPAEAAA